MAGGYSTPNIDPLDQLRSELADAKRRLDELERPTGSQLAQTVSNLASALANQVVPSVGGSSAAPVWGTAYATFTSFNFTVPTGYTRAVIVASGGSATFTNAAGDDYRMRVLINGVAGGESRGLTNDFAYVSAFSAANLTGLSAGSNIPIALQGHLTNGPGGTAGIAQLTGMVLFLK